MISLVTFLIAFLGTTSSAFADIYECTSQCLYVDSDYRVVQDLGVVMGAGRDRLEAFSAMKQDCETLAFNMDPCGPSQPSGVVLANGIDLYRRTDESWSRSAQGEAAIALALSRSGFAYARQERISSSQSSFTSSESHLVIHYSRANDPLVCRRQLTRVLPNLPRPERAERPYCGPDQPLG